MYRILIINDPLRRVREFIILFCTLERFSKEGNLGKMRWEMKNGHLGFCEMKVYMSLRSSNSGLDQKDEQRVGNEESQLTICSKS